jgi:hypothetical protein
MTYDVVSANDVFQLAQDMTNKYAPQGWRLVSVVAGQSIVHGFVERESPFSRPGYRD